MKRKIITWALVIEILTFSILVSFMSPVAVFALSASGLQTTIASVIISLMLQCGVAPVNQSWLNTLNASYGVESSIGTIQDCVNSGLLSQSGNTLIDTGLSAAIESQSAYTELGLSQIFTTSADDVAQGVIAGSGGVNLANVAINCGTLGTIGAFAGAVSVGVGIGVLINHVGNVFNNYIRSGVKINYNRDVINACPADRICYYNAYGASGSGNQYRIMYYYMDENICPVAYLINDYHYAIYGITRDGFKPYDWVRYKGDEYEARGSYGADSTIRELDSGLGVGNWGTPETNIPIRTNRAECDEYLNLYKNGEIQKPIIVSPDLIGKNGNHRANDGSIENTVPDGYDMNPVDMNDYQNYVDNANNNTEDGNTGEAVQGEQFDDLIDSLLVEPSIIPDQGIDTPDVPDRPIIPDQPETPGKDPITAEQQADVLEGITTPDLRSVFPFCIPFDLFALLGELKDVNREAPVLVWEMPEELGGYSIILDFSMFDDVAALLRLLELAVFIVGLAVETRNLIGAKG